MAFYPAERRGGFRVSRRLAGAGERRFLRGGGRGIYRALGLPRRAGLRAAAGLGGWSGGLGHQSVHAASGGLSVRPPELGLGWWQWWRRGSGGPAPAASRTPDRAESEAPTILARARDLGLGPRADALTRTMHRQTLLRPSAPAAGMTGHSVTASMAEKHPRAGGNRDRSPATVPAQHRNRTSTLRLGKPEAGSSLARGRSPLSDEQRPGQTSRSAPGPIGQSVMRPVLRALVPPDGAPLPAPTIAPTIARTAHRRPPSADIVAPQSRRIEPHQPTWPTAAGPGQSLSGVALGAFVRAAGMGERADVTSSPAHAPQDAPMTPAPSRETPVRSRSRERLTVASSLPVAWSTGARRPTLGERPHSRPRPDAAAILPPAVQSQSAQPANATSEDRFVAALTTERPAPPRSLPERLRHLVRRITGRADAKAVTGTASRKALDAAGARAATHEGVIYLPGPVGDAPGDIGTVAHELAHLPERSSSPRFLLRRPSAADLDPGERHAQGIGERVRHAAEVNDATVGGMATPPPPVSGAFGGPASPQPSTPRVGALPVAGLGGVREAVRAAVTSEVAGLREEFGGQISGARGASGEGLRPSGSHSSAAAPQMAAATTASGVAGTAGGAGVPDGAGVRGGEDTTLGTPETDDDFETLVERLEERILLEIERRGGRYSGIF